MSANLNKEKSIISLEKLEEFDFHIGLEAKSWNPKMKNFILSEKKLNRHIIDITKSLCFIEKAYNYIYDLVNAGIDIMFVGVKNKNTSPIIRDAVARVNGFYCTQRWLGGLLTNFPQISKTIKKLNDLEKLESDPEMQEKYTKKELIQFNKEKNKLEKFYSGIKALHKLPSLLIVFNPVEDVTAVVEAKKLGIPVVALANTNTNPDLIDFIIPGNNSSPKSVYIIANILCDAIAAAQGQETVVAFRDSDEIAIPEEYLVKKSNIDKNGFIHERGNTLLI